MIDRIIRTYIDAYSGLPREIWLLSTVLLINRSGAMVMMFLPLYLTKSLHFTDIQIGLLIGVCYGMGSVVAGLLGGRLTSRFGPIRLQLVCLMLAAPSYVILSFANSFWTVAAALSFLSITSEMVRPASITAATLFCPEHLYKRALGHNRLAVNLGMAIGGATGGFLAGINYSLLFYTNATTVFLAFLATLYFFGLREPPIRKPIQGEVSTSSPWLDGKFLVFLIFNLLTALVFFQLMSTFPKYLDEHLGQGEFELGLLMAVNTLLIVVVEMVLLQTVTHLNTLRVVAFGCFLSCLGFGLLPFGTGFWFVAFTVVIWTFGEMLAMPLSSAFVAERSSDANRGRYMGLYVTCYAIALVAGPIGGMWIYEQNPHAVWYIALGISVITFGGMYLLSVSLGRGVQNNQLDEQAG